MFRYLDLCPKQHVCGDCLLRESFLAIQLNLQNLHALTTLNYSHHIREFSHEMVASEQNCPIIVLLCTFPSKVEPSV